MKTQLKKRLVELQEELRKGEKMMAELNAKQANLKDSMLRIQGAIQVLEEELAKDQPSPVETNKPHRNDNGG